MGWLEIAFDAAMLSTQISQLNKLRQLQQQHADAQAIQVVVQVLRQQIFKFKQTCEELLALEKTNPKMTAGALEILYQRFQQAGLAPELFPEINDKEYVATTTRYLDEQRARLLMQWTPAEQIEIKHVADAAIRLPRYKTYLDHYDTVESYYEVLPIYETLKERRTPLTMANCLGTLLWVGFAMLLSFSSLFLEGRVPGYVIGLTLLLIIPGCILLSRWYTQPVEFKRVKSIVEKTEAEVDLEQFDELEKELGMEYETVHRQQQTAQQLVSQFFAGGNFSAVLTG